MKKVKHDSDALLSSKTHKPSSSSSLNTISANLNLLNPQDSIKMKPQIGFQKHYYKLEAFRIKYLQVKRLKNLKSFKAEMIEMSMDNLHPDPRRLFLALKAAKLFTSLSLDISDSEEAHFRRFRRGLLGLKKLRRLKLNFVSTRLLPFSFELKHIYRSLQRLKSIVSLSLDLTHNYNDFEHCLKGLFISLKKLPVLSRLRLIFKSISFSDQKMMEFAKILRRLRLLSRFDFNYSGCFQITKKGMTALNTSIKNLKKLKSLEIWYNFVSTQDQEIQPFNNSLRALPQLENLSLEATINSYLPLVRFPLEHFRKWVIFLRNQKALQTLKLNLSTLDLNDQVIRVLLLSLNHLKNLSNLTLLLYSASVTDKGIFLLFEFIKTLKNLSILHLTLSDVECLTDLSLGYISTALPELPLLTNLTLSFHRWKLTEKGIEEFMKSVGAVKNLKKLSLDFSTVFSSPNEPRILLQELGNLKSLTLLNLDLERNTCLDDDCFENLSQSLGQLKNLTGLNLNLSFSQDITDKGAEQISRKVRDLPVLRNFEFKLHNCKNISDAFLVQLGDDLKHMKYLEKFSFDVGFCSQTTLQGKLKLLQGLRESGKGLSSVNISFKERRGPPLDELKAFIRYHFKGILFKFDKEPLRFV